MTRYGPAPSPGRTIQSRAAERPKANAASGSLEHDGQQRVDSGISRRLIADVALTGNRCVQRWRVQDSSESLSLNAKSVTSHVGGDTLLDLDACGLDQPFAGVGLLLEERGEVLRRTADDFHAPVHQAFLDLRVA